MLESYAVQNGGPLPSPGAEVGVIVHNGREFCAGGASMSDDGRHLVCYVTGEPSARKATTWHGEALGTARIVSTWDHYVPGTWSRVRMSAVRVRLNDGRCYAGRMSLDSTQLFRGRLVRA